MHFSLPTFGALMLLASPLTTLASPVAKKDVARYGSGYEVGTFYVNWAIYGRKHFVTDLPASTLTRINYAFANINATTGEVFLSDPWADLQYNYPGDSDIAAKYNSSATLLYGNFNQLLKLKRSNRNLKTVLAVGGWSYRGNFKTALATVEGRTLFANSALELVKDLGLDGFDVDWEYPEDQTDADNLVDAVQRLRKNLDAYSQKYAGGYHFEITVSASAGPQNYVHLPIARLDPYVDAFNLMAFDYAGPSFSNFTGYLSNVYASPSNPKATNFSTAPAVAYYTSQLSSPSKLLLGLPAYGRSFASTTSQIGSPFNGTGSGTWDAGVLDYKTLPTNGSKVYTDRSLIASYSYNKKTKELVTYDTAEVQSWKADWLMGRGLGGAWWWDSSSDLPVSEKGSLVGTVAKRLGGVRAQRVKQNCITYSQSKYANVVKA